MAFLKTFLTNQVANEFFYHVRIGVSQFGSYKLLHSFFSAENLSDKIKLAPPTIMVSAQNEFKTLIFLTINAKTKVMLQFQYKTTFQ